ncbi:aminotransferase class V-fold PLP-dependent enzyme, partial [candidate division KSB1 bacterium]|nr:aminotransferase class V-fold PLP-dependent enzyme [candidate division KSB1 bacterium]
MESDHRGKKQVISDPAACWLLREGIDYLNHGSFGACPIPVLQFQQEMSRRLESGPWRFQVLELPKLQRVNREALAGFVNADADDLVFVPNVTHGVSTVLRSLAFKPGDELLTTNQDYFACHNALEFVARLSGARVVTVELPFPLRAAEEIIEAV